MPHFRLSPPSMLRKFSFALALVVLVTSILLGSVLPARATITSFSLSGWTCNTVGIFGYTDAPISTYVQYIMRNLTTGGSRGPYSSTVSGSGPTYTFSGTVDFDTTAAATDVIQVTVSDANQTISRQGTCAAPVPPSISINLPTFTDGRLNQDAGQTAAVYCSAGGVNVYAVKGGKGISAFNVTAAQIAKTVADLKTAKQLYESSLVSDLAGISSRTDSISRKQNEINQLQAYLDHPFSGTYDAVVGFMKGQGKKDRNINRASAGIFAKDRIKELRAEIRSIQNEIDQINATRQHITHTDTVALQTNYGVTLWVSVDGSLYVTGPSLDPTKPKEIYKFSFSC